MDVCVQSQLHTGLEAPGRTLCLKNLCSLPITWPPPTVTASLVWVCRMPTACKGLSVGGGVTCTGIPANPAASTGFTGNKDRIDTGVGVRGQVQK